MAFRVEEDAQGLDGNTISGYGEEGILQAVVTDGGSGECDQGEHGGQDFGEQAGSPAIAAPPCLPFCDQGELEEGEECCGLEEGAVLDRGGAGFREEGEEGEEDERRVDEESTAGADQDAGEADEEVSGEAYRIAAGDAGERAVIIGGYEDDREGGGGEGSRERTGAGWPEGESQCRQQGDVGGADHQGAGRAEAAGPEPVPVQAVETSYDGEAAEGVLPEGLARSRPVGGAEGEGEGEGPGPAAVGEALEEQQEKNCCSCGQGDCGNFFDDACDGDQGIGRLVAKGEHRDISGGNEHRASDGIDAVPVTVLLVDDSRTVPDVIVDPGAEAVEGEGIIEHDREGNEGGGEGIAGSERAQVRVVDEGEQDEEYRVGTEQKAQYTLRV